MSVSARRPEQRRLKVFCVLSSRSTQKTFLLKGDCVALVKFGCILCENKIKDKFSNLNIVRIPRQFDHFLSNPHTALFGKIAPIPSRRFRRGRPQKESARASTRESRAAQREERKSGRLVLGSSSSAIRCQPSNPFKRSAALFDVQRRSFEQSQL